MDILARLDHARAAVNVLEHPFYQRWSAGELSTEELGCYAGEYRHAVLALARTSSEAAAHADAERRSGLEHHAQEGAAHVALWDQFAYCARAGDAPQLAQTRQCAECWVAGENLLEHLAVLYVVEAGQPEISRTKLEGLSAHYGYAEESPATEYFRLHETPDVEHALHAGALIEALLSESAEPHEQADRVVSRASTALQGNWMPLDGVETHARGQ
jgi:pyrroloquinoline-quinone synthase